MLYAINRKLSCFLKSLPRRTVGHINHATVMEPGATDGPKHRCVVRMCVNAQVVNLRETEIQTLPKRTGLHTRRSQSVNRSIRRIVQPSPLYPLVGWVRAQDKGEDKANLPFVRDPHKTMSRRYLLANQLLRRVSIHPLRSVPARAHKASCRVINGHQGLQILYFCRSNHDFNWVEKQR